MMTLLAASDWPAQVKGTLPFILGFLVPAVALWLKVAVVEKHRNKQRRAPTDRKLLRPPGYSLMLQLDEEYEKWVSSGLYVFGCWSFAVGLLPVLLRNTRFLFVHWIGAVSLSTIVGLFAVAVWVLVRATRQLNRIRQLKLGLRGEQAVGEILTEVADVSYRSFHDLPGDGKWNVDHVCVGAQGVFVLETKARRKPVTRAGKAQYKITQNGQTLVFPDWQDAETIPQATRNARWVAEYLTKKTGEKVTAEALVVVPGWWVEQTSPDCVVRTMNAKTLAGYLRAQPMKLQSPQVRRIIAALDEKCRTLEF